MSDQSEWVRERLLAILCGLLALSLFGAVFSLGAKFHWVADIAANLRIQQIMVLLGMTLGISILRKWRWFVVIVFVWGLHLPFLWPSIISSKPVVLSEEPRLRVMLANVLRSNTEHHRVLAACESYEPDVVVILELSFALAGSIDEAWRSSYPHRKVLPQDSWNFGIGIYSNTPMSDLNVFSTTDDIASIEATINHHGKSCRLIATHPIPPIGASHFRKRNRQLDDIASRVQMSVGVPCVVVGDLNLTPWSSAFSSFAKKAGLRRATAGHAATPTWYAGPKEWFPLGLALDHALISDSIVCTSYGVGESIGSDHRPVLWELAFRP